MLSYLRRTFAFARSSAPSEDGAARGVGPVETARTVRTEPAYTLRGVAHDVILARIQSDDLETARTAFETLFTATYADLTIFALRAMGARSSSGEAEDLVMELFRRVWERRASWQPDDMRIYLFGAVRNVVQTHRRDAVRRAMRLAEHVHPDTPIPAMGRAPQAPDATVEEHERIEALARAVVMLPDRQRLIFSMRREQGLSNAETARILGVAIKTVEKELTALIKTLREAVIPRPEP